MSLVGRTGVGPANQLRSLPSVGHLLELWPGASPARDGAADALRTELAGIRAALLEGDITHAPDATEIVRRAAAALVTASRPALRRVINATGIILHTNLGRAPLPAVALDAVLAVAGGYSNLEMDLEAGERGSRLAGVEPLLRNLTGAEAALAVNNCAAAVLLALAGLAGGGEVIVSRGELVEIGGEFRIPDVIVQGGARLVEVGTTNRTRIADYRAAITPATRLLLKVHQSNYRITGFTAEASLGELAALAREAELLVVHDLGSGAMGPLGPVHEPTARDSIAAGADVVVFSGDKLGGGPQCGMLVGRLAPIAVLKRHPLMRALRLDKMTLAALEAVLRLHASPSAAAGLPVLRMLGQPVGALQDRAARLCTMLAVPARVEASHGFAGGGTLPTDTLPSRAAVLTVPGVDGFARGLRMHHPAVVGRITAGELWLDMLAVGDVEVPEIAAAVRTVLAA